ncbi:MAG: MoaD/ThiS family protein, partial [Chthoniobacterales bacterium]
KPSVRRRAHRGRHRKQMNVTVEFLGEIREVTGQHELLIDLADSTRVADLIDRLIVTFPAMADHRSSLSILAGLDYVDEHHSLTPNETISLTVE